jgi:hypothetical protein
MPVGEVIHSYRISVSRTGNKNRMSSLVVVANTCKYDAGFYYDVRSLLSVICMFKERINS